MMIENEYGVATPALAAGALAFIFIAYLYSKLSKFETGTDIGVPQLDGLSLQVGPRTPSTHTPITRTPRAEPKHRPRPMTGPKPRPFLGQPIPTQLHPNQPHPSPYPTS